MNIECSGRRMSRPAIQAAVGQFDVEHNPYGFRWGEVLIERTASVVKPRKYQIIRVFAPNGQIVEIGMSARKVFVEIHEKEKR